MAFLIEAVIACLIFTLMVAPFVAKNPLAWVSDYPPAIQERVRELGLISMDQKKIPAAVIIRKVSVSLVSAVLLALVLVFVNGAETFWKGALLSYGLWLVVVWYDALVLDCLWFCHSKKVIIPGTEDMVDAYHDYGFHIKMSGVGMVIGIPVCLLTGLVVMCLNMIVP